MMPYQVMSYQMMSYHAVREEVGLIDRSEAGKLAIVGADRYTWLQGMVSNDVRLLGRQATAAPDAPRPALRACILDATGHVLTDLTLIDVNGAPALAAALGLPAPDFVLLDLPRLNLARIAALLDRFLITEDVEIVDVTARLGCLSLQGPGGRTPDAATRGRKLLAGIGGPQIAIVADHTGSGGSDHYFVSAATPAVPPADAEIALVDTATQELLRIEAGIPKYGADLDETVIALEANLGPTHISLSKGCYMGQEIIARIDSRGHTNRALTGLVFTAGAPPQPGDRIFAADDGTGPGRETGRITSVAAVAPAAEGRPIALGYVRHEHRAPGTRLRVGEAGLTAEVRELPFYRSGERGTNGEGIRE